MLQEIQYILQKLYYFNEFVENVLRDNMGSKKNQLLTSEKNEAIF